MKRAFKEIVQNAANEYAKQKEDEIRSSENQMHNKNEKKLADQISKVLEQKDNDMMHVQEKHTKLITQMKQDHIEQLNCLREITISMWKNFKYMIKLLEHEHGAMFQKLEDRTSSVVLEQEDKKTSYMWKNFKYAIKLFGREHGAMFQKLEDRTSSVVLEQKDKAVKAIEKIEASCAIKLANCKEELTKQQLMHIQEEHTKLVTHMQQYNSERLKDLRQKTITMSIEVATVFKELGDRLEVKGQMLEEKLLPYKQCNLQHKEDEKKLADQISKVLEQSDKDMMHVQEKHDKLITQMKQDHSEQLKCLKEKTRTTWKCFEYVTEELECGLEDKCQKLENQFSSDVLVEEKKAVKDIEEIKASHDKILAECKEESTRQQLLHILEEHTKLVTGMQQDHREQLKALRQETIAMWEYFENEIEVLVLLLDCEGHILEDELLQLDDDDEGDQSLEADELLLLLLEK